MLAEALDAHRKSAPTWLLYLQLHSLNVRLLRAAGESVYIRPTVTGGDFCGRSPAPGRLDNVLLAASDTFETACRPGTWSIVPTSGVKPDVCAHLMAQTNGSIPILLQQVPLP